MLESDYMKKITFLFSIVLYFLGHSIFAQVVGTREVNLFGKKETIKNGSVIRCASTQYEEFLKSKKTNRLSKTDFENWITPKVLESKKKQSESKGFRTNVLITIPVVVHVIHNGDVIGGDENIFDEQVISQIRVLNEDFRRRVSTPGFNSDAVGADTEIEFALAKRDPAGVLSNGIDRVSLTQENWSLEDIDAIVKPQTIWNPEKYLNIWVVKFSDQTVLGYAQFPSQSGLSGINANEGIAATDGVVIGYRFFGSSSYFAAGTYGADYDKGRTTTHEVGHWLGLRHIWGDGEVGKVDGCTVDDFCNDTPNAKEANEGCPTRIVDSCPDSAGVDMFRNYMDYTDDACMNIFTADQKLRMTTVLNNSARRVSLKNSDALTAGTVFTNDASILIVKLNLTSCSNSFAPVLKIVNKGSATITLATIRFGIDNANFRTVNWTGNLAPGETENITLNSLTTIGGNHSFIAEILTVNGTTDQNNNNNTETLKFSIVKSYATTSINFVLQRDFFGQETTWTLKNTLGTTVFEGGPYTNTSESAPLPAPFQTTFNLINNECYTFTIEDTEEDGICCEYGNGSYTLTTPTGEIIASGGEFGASESTSFRIDSLGNSEVKRFSSLILYPNPASTFINIFAENKLEIPEMYTLINNLGQIIESKTLITSEDLEINVSGLSKGIYFLKLTKNNFETKTIQFIRN
ncbi:Por secretion system C-terminal sorting domain-containing protein [Flavobacterium micromati]|uniref:Por secretion system C-terminal sorting domain-containing protein n=2 Tax=Flavobacterium micromati TaxID=229205 RepID=A0A1M5LJD0_9FLAO|nr:Por secretion system C-terminal sorting domain-containing protein [Flavobacterium micromati]